MRTHLLPLAAALSALALPAPAQPPAGNAEALAAERAFEDAQGRRDRAALEAALAPDFLVVQGSGRLAGRADYLDGFATSGATLEPTVVGDRMFVRVSPDVAVAGGEARTTGTENGRRFTAHYRFAHTLVRRDGRWLVVFAQITPRP